MTEIGKYHELAKDAGNRLRAYILSVSSGATGVFFLALTKQDKVALSCMEKWFLSLSLLAFVITVALCLYELRIDAQRFFCLAKELEKEEGSVSRFFLQPVHLTLSVSSNTTAWPAPQQRFGLYVKQSTGYVPCALPGFLFALPPGFRHIRDK
ncbi:MAG: hypothetical protein ACL93V_10900 [Candidatus Electrothrix sp. YB6]